MILVRISGGLGNQLFQYATARSISIKLNRKLYLDDSWYREIDSLEDFSNPNATTKREFLLTKFNIKSTVLNDFYLNWIKRLDIKTKNNKFFKYLKSHLFQNLSFTSINSKHYSWDLMSNSKKIYLKGYWQNNIIIEEFRDSLITECKPSLPISENNNQYLTSISSSNSVAVHFRRGDYINKPLSRKIHATCSNNYYYTAINFLQKKMDDLHLFIFSDDISWVKNNFTLNGNITYISNDGTEYEHLYLMSNCKHQITANSTYSWWAAWLNENPDKIVITPKYWYYDKKLNETIIRIPDNWIKINNLI